MDLHPLYSKFCAFGGGPALRLTSQKFSKMCKDTKVTGNGPRSEITGADTDIVFNKVKGKGERTIDYHQMIEALHVLALKKFGNDAEGAFNRLAEEMLEVGGPRLAEGATRTDHDATLGRLTDTSKYAGTAKNRFDENGKGKGRDGRTEDTGVLDFAQITNRKTADKRGVQANSFGQ